MCKIFCLVINTYILKLYCRFCYFLYIYQKKLSWSENHKNIERSESNNCVDDELWDEDLSNGLIFHTSEIEYCGRNWQLRIYWHHKIQNKPLLSQLGLSWAWQLLSSCNPESTGTEVGGWKVGGWKVWWLTCKRKLSSALAGATGS